MLARRSLAVVLVTDRAPPDSLVAQVLGDLRVWPGLAVERILALADRAGERVRHAEEQVSRDVLQMAPVGEPLPAAEMWSVVHLPFAFTSTGIAR